MDITVPGFIVDEPKYAGPVDQAHFTLVPSVYQTTNPERALVITEHASFLIPIADVGEIPDATGGYLIDDGREMRTMVTIETVERLALRASAVLEADHLDPDTAVSHAQQLLRALVDATTTRTASEVKDLADTDAVSSGASRAVRRVLAKFDTTDKTIADSYSRLDHRYIP